MPAHAEAPVQLAIVNTGEQALRCTVMFAHWVTSGVGPIAPGASRAITMMRRQPGGALFVAREDGRPMMIETIICGTDQDWAAHLGQVPLTALRSSDAVGFQADCAARGQVACTVRRLGSAGR